MIEEDNVTALKIANNQLAKDKAVAEQLLAHVLFEVGEPVFVAKSDIKKGFEGLTIDITEDGQFFKFELVKNV